MARARSRLGKLSWALAALLPAVLLPTLMAKSVGPLAEGGATLLRSLSSRLPASSGVIEASAWSPAPFDFGLFNGAPDIAAPDIAAPSRVGAAVLLEPRQRTGQRRSAPAGKRTLRRIYVSPDMVRRAVPAAGRPAAAWTTRSDDHPAGMQISNPGALAGTIHAGDVLFEAEGRPLASFEQLVAIVAQGYQRRTKLFSGRLWRRGELWTITVEPGWAVDSSGTR